MPPRSARKKAAINEVRGVAAGYRALRPAPDVGPFLRSFKA